METKSHNVTVGAFVLAGIVALVAAVLVFGGGQYVEPRAFYETSFNGSVAGLAKGTIVRYNGIDVGHVGKLEFDRANPRTVNATLEVRPDLRLHVDSVASVESEGITGGTYVEITGGTPNSPYAMPEAGQRYPFIGSKPSPLQQLKNVAPDMLRDIDTAADRAGQLLNDENREAFAQTLNNVSTATDRASDLLNEKNRKAFADALANLTIATKQLNATLQTTDDGAKRVGQLSSHVDEVVSASQKQIEDGAAQFNRLLSESRVLVSSLTRLSNDIERQPTSLLFGDNRKGYTPK